jgi:hypothetical protein
LPEVSTAWLVGVARHKLVDHWRRLGREQRSLAAAEASATDVDDPWDRLGSTSAMTGRLALASDRFSSKTHPATRSRCSNPRPGTTSAPAESKEHTHRMIQDTDTVHVRHIVEDVAAAVHLYTTQPVVAPCAELERPSGSAIIVERTSRTSAEHGTCALCWTGPEPLAGTVRRAIANAAEARAICSRCLVTLEMLAVQFDSQLQLRIETSA